MEKKIQVRNWGILTALLLALVCPAQTAQKKLPSSPVLCGAISGEYLPPTAQKMYSLKYRIEFYDLRSALKSSSGSKGSLDSYIIKGKAKIIFDKPVIREVPDEHQLTVDISPKVVYKDVEIWLKRKGEGLKVDVFEYGDTRLADGYADINIKPGLGVKIYEKLVMGEMVLKDSNEEMSAEDSDVLLDDWQVKGNIRNKRLELSNNVSMKNDSEVLMWLKGSGVLEFK